jgi:hypothetical protein
VTDDERRISREEARRLWKRAAELQTEASTRLDRESGDDASQGAGDLDSGYPLAQVRAAAADAGIAPEFVDLALAEGGELESPGSPRSRLARWLSGPGGRSAIASCRFEYSASVVQAAVLRVFPNHHLTLIDSRPIGPNDGGALTFALSVGPSEGIDFIRDLYQRAGVREVHLRIEPRGEAACVVVVSAPLRTSAEGHLVHGLISTVAGGAIGAWSVGALGAFAVLQLGVTSLVAGASIGVAMALGLGAGGRIGLGVSRTGFQTIQRAGAVALERLLQLVAVDLRLGLPPAGSSTDGSRLPPG